MSFKSKNLEFDANEPAFLRRLRGQARGNVDDPDRHLNPTVLPKKPKRLENDDDDDDAPAYVLEGSDANISKAEYEALTGVKSAGATEDGKNADEEEQGKPATDPLKPDQNVAVVGAASKKRKAVRVGEDDTDEEPGEKKAASKGKPTTLPKKPKKKTKAIKLSFGDDEGA